MQIHVPPMTFKDDHFVAEWSTGLKNQSDAYGQAVYRYASEWATRMEAKMKADGLDQDSEPAVDEWIKANADKIGSDADTEGITGFMYGCAMQMLSAWWKHGERLRRWHNINTQIGSEGEKANESGGVLNPALLNVSVPE